MATKRWQDLSPRTRRLLVMGMTIEGTLKIVALFDLVRRPARQVRGSKWRWAAAIVFINSAGIVPLSYLVRGRRVDSV